MCSLSFLFQSVLAELCQSLQRIKFSFQILICLFVLSYISLIAVLLLYILSLSSLVLLCSSFSYFHVTFNTIQRLLLSTIYCLPVFFSLGLPWGLSSKESSSCPCRRHKFDPQEKEMATHSNILAREIPWTVGYSPWGSKESDIP